MHRLLITFVIVPIICCNGLLKTGVVGILENTLKKIGEIGFNDDELFNNDLPTPQEIVEAQGYTAETHKVVTQDGYILQVHRITGSKVSPKAYNKPVVFLQHGLVDCSATWVMGPTNKGLSYMLADRGYDVWMGNTRGNRYSRKHINLTTADREYWQFSWHEMGVYDLPAMIDYALATTGQKQLIYVGHSQGGTSFFVMASMRPDYQQKIKVAITLAPAVFMGHATLPLVKFLTLTIESLKALGDKIGIYEFAPTNLLFQQVVQTKCIDVQTELCGTLVSLLISPGEVLLNQTIAARMSKYDPAGCSLSQVAHYTQLHKSGRFTLYDHGPSKNLELYNSEFPPDYPLEEITIPVYLHYGNNDGFVNPKDIHILYNKIQNGIKFLNPHPAFSHVDFVWCEPLDVLLNNKVVSQIEAYTFSKATANIDNDVYLY